MVQAGGSTGRRRVAVLVSAVALLTTACGGGDSDHPAAEPSTASLPSTGPEPELPTVPTTWGDGYDHVVVLTEHAATVGSDDDIRDDEPDSAEADVGGPQIEARPGPSTPKPGNTLPVSTVAPGSVNVATTEPTLPAQPTEAAVASLAMPPTRTESTRTEPSEQNEQNVSVSFSEAPHTQAVSADRDVLVTRADGSSEDVKIPDGSLRTTPVVNQSEADFLARYAAEPLAVLVKDVDGVVGAIGRRYVMIPGRLIEVPGQPTSDPGQATGDGPEITEPATTETTSPTATTESGPPESEEPERVDTTEGPLLEAPSDEEILDVILELPGVVSAELVAPGVIAAVLSGDRDDLRRVPGVVSVENDTLFDIAADPDEAKQWMLKNTGSSSQAGGWSGTPGADANVEAAWTVSQGAGTIVAVGL